MHRVQVFDSRGVARALERMAAELVERVGDEKLLYLVGVNRAVELAQELGYTTLTDPDRYGLSLVLGAARSRPSPRTSAKPP